MKPAREILAIVLICTSATLAQPILYVDADATGPTHNGSSWCNAYVYLQDALTAARASNGAVTEIRVANGVYTPDQGADQSRGSRYAVFQLVDGVALMGGYPGCGAVNPDARDPATSETVLSGDLFANDDTVGPLENSLVILRAERVGPATRIDGLTITQGWGGQWNTSASPTIVNTRFITNYSGALISWNGSNPLVSGCYFFNNAGSAATGGNDTRAAPSNPTYSRCVFIDNFERSFGGAVMCVRGITIFDRCRFLRNSTFHGFGGAVAVLSGEASFVDCEFQNNHSEFGFGGAVFVEGGTGRFRDCILNGNVAGSGGGIASLRGTVLLTGCTLAHNVATSRGGGLYGWFGHYSVENTIVWNNVARTSDQELAQIYSEVSTPQPVTVNHSLIQGLTGALAGVGNIGGDPRFVDPLGPDGIAGTEDDDLRLQRGSPCIDAGDNGAVPPDTFDLDGDGDTTEPAPFDFAGRPRFVNDPLTPDTGLGQRPIVDMGAFERQVVLFDIDPGRCPNRLQRRSHGLVQAAVVGTDAFDVSLINRESLLLTRADGQGGSIRPDVSHGRHDRPFRDVTSPFDGDLCDCSKARRDGIDDLVLRFRANDIADLLDDDSKHGGDSATLTLTGLLRDGTPFDASDCVRIMDRREP